MGYTGFSDEGLYDAFDNPYARWVNDNFFKPGLSPKDLMIKLADKGLFGSPPEDQVANSSNSYRGTCSSPRLPAVPTAKRFRIEHPEPISSQVPFRQNLWDIAFV